MALYNKAILVGRLTSDPELKQTPNGVSVTSFSIAVNRPYTNKQTGEREVDFIDLVAWRGTAEFICRYFSKGRAILVEGSIQTRTYVDKQGQNRRAWEVVVDNAHFVESKKDAQGSSAGGSYGTPPPAHSGPATPAPMQSPASSAQDQDDMYTDDGDLPF